MIKIFSFEGDRFFNMGGLSIFDQLVAVFMSP